MGKRAHEPKSPIKQIVKGLLEVSYDNRLICSDTQDNLADVIGMAPSNLSTELGKTSISAQLQRRIIIAIGGEAHIGVFVKLFANASLNPSYEGHYLDAKEMAVNLLGQSVRLRSGRQSNILDVRKSCGSRCNSFENPVPEHSQLDVSLVVGVLGKHVMIGLVDGPSVRVVMNSAKSEFTKFKLPTPKAGQSRLIYLTALVALDKSDLHGMPNVGAAMNSRSYYLYLDRSDRVASDVVALLPYRSINN
jgi:hypothetical protein